MKLDQRKLSKEITGSYRTERNALVRELKPDPADRIEVEIGDTKQDEFLPQLKLKRWDDEVNFSLRWQDDDPTPAEVISEGKTIKYVKGTKEAHFYELDKGEGMEDGGYEFEVVFSEKPDTNAVNFSIQTKELDFFYQPALTQKEVEEGAERPENVIGSYAVYHKSQRDNRVGGKEYKTGKAFHIYRPKATDAAGNETWAQLNIDEEQGSLSVTVPQNFLDSAAYPVIVDPTFGYTSNGGSTSGSYNSSFLYGVKFTPSEAGTIDSISGYVKFSFAASPGIKFALYGDSPYNLLATAITNVNASMDSPLWFTGSASYSFSASTVYLLSLNKLDTPSRASAYYDSGSSDQASYDSDVGTYATRPENPWTPSNANSLARNYSIYATYTAGGGGTSVTVTPSAQAIPTNSSAVTVAAVQNISTSVSAHDIPSNSPSATVPTPATLEFQVGASADDAEVREDNTGHYSHVGTSIALGKFYNLSQESIISGYRFTGITIPQGAAIQSASLSLFSYYKNTATIVVRLAAQDIDSPSGFNSGDTPAQRTKTTASVQWNVTGANWTDAAFNVSPDIGSAIQEVVDRVGWTSGNALVVLVEDDGSDDYSGHSVATYDADPNAAAKLSITYLSAGTDVTVSPVAQGVSIGNPSVTVTATESASAFASAQSISVVTPTATVATTRFVSIAAGVQGVSVNGPSASAITQVSTAVNLSAQTLSVGSPSAIATGSTNISVPVTAQAIGITDPSVTVAAIRNETISASAQEIASISSVVTTTADRHVTTEAGAQEIAAASASVSVSTRRSADVAVTSQELLAMSPAANVNTANTTDASANASMIVSISPQVSVTTIRNTLAALETQAIASQSPSAQVRGAAVTDVEAATLTIGIPPSEVTAVRNAAASADASEVALTSPELTVSTIRSEMIGETGQAVTIGNPAATVSTQDATIVPVAASSVSAGNPTVDVATERSVDLTAQASALTVVSPSVILSVSGNVNADAKAGFLTVASPTVSIRGNAGVSLQTSPIHADNPPVMVEGDANVLLAALALSFGNPEVAVSLARGRYQRGDTRFHRTGELDNRPSGSPYNRSEATHAAGAQRYRAR